VRGNLGGLFRRTLVSAAKHSNMLALCNVLVAAEAHYALWPSILIKSIFIKALRLLTVENDYTWLRIHWLLWRDNALIKALSEQESEAVLDALVACSHLEYSSEDITASIAEKWP